MKQRRWNRKLKHPRVIIALVVVLSLLCAGLFLFMTRTTDLDRLSMSVRDTLNKKDVQEHVKTSFKEDYQLQDYGIYGQTLTLYQKEYGSRKSDALIGTMVVLRNVETQQELSFAIGESADSGIQLGTLDPGLYEIYIYDNYDKKRVYFKEAFDSETFSTVRNEKHVLDITLHASKKYLADFGITYDKNYVFLEVNENIPQVKVADIVLDAGGNVYNEISMQNEPGIMTEYIQEPQETLSFVKLVQKDLEDKGLRVILSRSDDSSLSYYGSSSRVGSAYASKAKAFISFEVYEDESMRYPYILTSRYTKGLLANEIAYAFKDAGLNMEAISNNSYQSASVSSDSGQTLENSDITYDLYPQLRETGGKQTFAGQLDTATANQDYQDAYGMESVVFMLANGDSQESVAYYTEHKEQMAHTIAKAICDYYGIGENSETASQ